MKQFFERLLSAFYVLTKSEIILIEVNRAAPRPYLTYWTTIEEPGVEIHFLKEALKAAERDEEKITNFIEQKR